MKYRILDEETLEQLIDFLDTIQMEASKGKYKDDIDILNITPGIVITEQNKFLKDALFVIEAEKHVSNIIKMLGNVNGNHSAYWGHDISSLILNDFIYIFDLLVLISISIKDKIND